jgi:hydroxymethylpyrimidine/phosphomethylpyrimidine kinase
MHEAARRIRALGPRVVVVKGGHFEDPDSPEVCLDVVSGEDGDDELRGSRLPGPHTHGTGCTFASAIAAHLARGTAAGDAIRAARAFVEGTIRHAPGLGHGRGPLNHFWAGILK